jgi:two-component system, NtrC family, sensor histidine kinase KinB
VRHTPNNGKIEVRTYPTDGTVRFEVTDTGEGIPPEYQRRIFDKFFRVPGSASNGAGLGLSIAKEVVLGHGGEIGVESQPGQGSTFWFTLPRVAAHNSKGVLR